MIAKDFKSKISPWFNIGTWMDWVKSNNITIKEGHNHNLTDGGVHYILTKNKKRFEVIANSWDYRTGWDDGIVWVNNIK